MKRSGTQNEDVPLLTPTTQGHSTIQEPDLGTTRFPLHPEARTTPRWRKWFLYCFPGHRAMESLHENDIWPLEPTFQGLNAAMELLKHLPTGSARLRLFRGVVAANRGRLWTMVVLNLVSVVFAVMRPVLLYQLLRHYTDNHGVVTMSSAILYPLVGMVIARMAFTFVTCHCYILMDRIQLQVYSSLYAMITGDTPSNTVGRALLRGHNQQLGEATNLLTNDLSAVGDFLIIIFDAWTVVLKLAMSITVLIHVVEVSWRVIATAIGSFAALLIIEMIIGEPLTARAESTLMARLNTVRACLKGIQTIKLNAWEAGMETKIQRERASERGAATRLRILTVISQELIGESPMLLAALLFGSMANQTIQTLTPARVFTALLLLSDCLRYGRYFKYAFEQALVGAAAWRRVESFVLNDVELAGRGFAAQSRTSSFTRTSSGSFHDDVLMEFSGVCLTASDTIPASPGLLVNVNWSLHEGELVVIHGAGGVGKSMLLSAIRGDASGVRVLNGDSQGLPPNYRIAYCSQDPCLQTASIRDNILFGTPFDEQKYWVIVDACGLLEDLAMLPAGDAAMVGADGINLSCGQSVRIALARACYADADVYLLDCPLTNVDSVVQSKIFYKCIVELLMFKTVVMVTHNPEYIGSSYVDQLVEVKPLSVRVANRRSRSYSGLRNGEFRSRRVRDRHFDIRRRASEDHTVFTADLSQDSIRLVELIKSKHRSTIKAHEAPTVHPTGSTHITRAYLLGTTPRQFVFRLVMIVLLIAWGSLCAMRDLWVMEWSASISAPQNLHQPSLNNDSGAVKYANFVLGCITLCLVVRAVVFVINSQSVSNLFTAMTHAVLRAPMTFFYHLPLGNVFNRYLTDLAIVDDLLPTQVSEVMLSSASFISRTIVLGWCLGSAGLVVILVGYAAMARMLSLRFRVQIMLMRQRVNAKLLSSISEIVDGEAVIRSFGDHRIKHAFRSLDTINNLFKRVTYFATIFNSSTVLHCDVVSTVLVLLLLGILSQQSIPPLQFGLALLYIFLMQQEVVHVGTGLGNTCVALRSIERLCHYGVIPVETNHEMIPIATDPVPQWFAVGDLTFETVDFAYTDQSTALGIPLVLQEVSFSIRGGEKVGIIGRTGSGKSSLAMALLRMHPLRRGRILLDGVDLGSLPLDQLRRTFTIIPQSPTFYRCSIRDYLDPFHELDDSLLWHELLTVELGSRVQSLDEELLDNGENWSLGQRQLLCFARALLKPSPVVILDEAFSCIDQSCQETIVRIVRERMHESTVLLITHRLDQILSFDRILVMAKGRLVESGSASELASDAGSLFYEFLEKSQLTFSSRA